MIFFQFRKIITRYRRIGYNLNDVMRQSACLVFNRVMIFFFFFFFFFFFIKLLRRMIYEQKELMMI